MGEMPTGTNRRSFLMASGLTALAASQVMGANDTLRVGVIGTGGRMKTLLHAADQSGPYQLVAACDVYSPNLDKVKQRANNVATTHVEYREVLDMKELDAVIIAAPDH
jgi:predicted dehydrogenase